MSTVLSNGVIVPDVGSTNWASDLETNWTLLNALIGAVGANVRLDRPNIWTAAQTFSDGIYGDLDGTAAMAVSDANGNEIATTYALKTEVTALATAVSGKAADSEVVHLAGAETITGDKTHDANLGITGNHLFAWDRPQVTIGTNPTSGVYFGTQRFRDSNGDTFLLIRGTVNANGNTFYSYALYPWSAPTEARGWTLSTTPNASISYFNPIGEVNLGSTSSKWQSINGINPGALSLPKIVSAESITLDTTNWDYTGANWNALDTSAMTGWGYIYIANCGATDFVLIRQGGTGTQYPTQSAFPILYNDNKYYLHVTFPIVQNSSVYCEIRTSGTVKRALVYPCLGNV